MASLTYPRTTSYIQRACVVSSNVICSGPLKLFRNRIIAAASVATIVSMTTFPSASRTATTVVAWCRSNPIYLSHFIERPFLCSTRQRSMVVRKIPLSKDQKRGGLSYSVTRRCDFHSVERRSCVWFGGYSVPRAQQTAERLKRCAAV